MKPTSLLINTARGPVVNAKALADALKNNIIAGAGVDVLIMNHQLQWIIHFLMHQMLF